MPTPENSADEPPQPSWADRMEQDDLQEGGPEEEVEATADGDLKTVVMKNVLDGRPRKITRVFKVEKRMVPVAVAKRRGWKKFGDAAEDLQDGPDLSTTRVADEVFLTLTTNKETLEQQEDDALKKLGASQHKMVSCRICKGDHWTSKCPYKDSIGTMNMLEEPGSGAVTQQQQVEQSSSQQPMGGAEGGGEKKYVPPNQRDRDKAMGRGETMMGKGQHDDDQATVRVTNLSEETLESDLRELFTHCGPIKRIFLAKDKITQQSKGFAFVSFQSRSYAQKAIDVLNGYGYDHLILKVEWAKPSKTH